MGYSRGEGNTKRGQGTVPTLSFEKKAEKKEVTIPLAKLSLVRGT